MNKLDEFLNIHHNLKPRSKKVYLVAVNGFEKTGQCKFEESYLNPQIVHTVLSKWENPKSNHHIEDSTWNSWIIYLRCFAKWLSDPDNEKAPKLWRDIKLKVIDWDERLKNKWLSEEEFLDLLNETDNLCHRAMWATCVSGALRAGELLSLKVGNVEVQGNETRVTVSGKTGTRSFVMNQFSAILKMWVNFHPLKHDPSAALWIRRKGDVYSGLHYRQVNDLLKFYCKRAGIKKNVTPHWLRHTKVSWVARNRKVKVNDKIANAMFGWTPNSASYKHYTRIHGTDTDDTFRLLEGVEEAEKKVEAKSPLTLQKCFNCNENNAADAMYCLRCGMALNEDAAREVLLRRQMQDELLKMQPELMRLLKERFKVEKEKK